MILLQIIVAASLIRSHGRRKSVEPMRIESDGKPEDIPITVEEALRANMICDTYLQAFRVQR